MRSGPLDGLRRSIRPLVRLPFEVADGLQIRRRGMEQRFDSKGLSRNSPDTVWKLQSVADLVKGLTTLKRRIILSK